MGRCVRVPGVGLLEDGLRVSGLRMVGFTGAPALSASNHPGYSAHAEIQWTSSAPVCGNSIAAKFLLGDGLGK